MTRVALRALLLLALSAVTTQADEGALPSSLQKVGFDQHLGEQVPLEVAFKDEAGRTVTLGDYFNHGRPVILVLAYFRCPQLCSEILNGLTRARLEMNLDLGSEFEVVTVSFDSRETPDMAAAKKKSYVERYARPGAGVGWHFLTGNDESIARLTKAVGFRYSYDAKHDQFAHASGIMVLTPGGTLARYFYDVHFAPRDLRLGLVEASSGRVGSPVDQILLYCFHYDPTDGKYGVTIMNVVRLGGVLTVLGIALMVFLLRRGERRRAKALASTAR